MTTDTRCDSNPPQYPQGGRRRRPSDAGGPGSGAPFVRRPTTYTYQFYAMRERGEMDGLTARAVDLLAYLCHLADRYKRDGVFKRQRELAAALRCDERTIRLAIRALEGTRFVYVDPHRARPGAGYRRATLFTMGPAFPEDARWGMK